jgi:hypothetical protein
MNTKSYWGTESNTLYCAACSYRFWDGESAMSTVVTVCPHLTKVNRQAVWPIPMPQDESLVARRAQLRSELPPSSSRIPVRNQGVGNNVTEW